MPFRVALDWTPNTLHIGLFAARAQAWFAEAGLSQEVSFVSPDIDEYKKTPAARLHDQEVEVAIAPSESVISYQTLSHKASLVAIGAIAQQDSSAIVTLEDSGLRRPADLDGKLYASYGARFEDYIVRQMIRNDGGQGDLNITHPNMLGIFNVLIQGAADATWVFMPWEGVEARREGLSLHAFRMGDYDIPYGYTPVMLAHPDLIQAQEADYKAFMSACARGYQWAVHHPQEAAALLRSESGHPSCQDIDFLVESMYDLAPHLLREDGRWGLMNPDRWTEFAQWLCDHKILGPDAEALLDANRLFTNNLLPRQQGQGA